MKKPIQPPQPTPDAHLVDDAKLDLAAEEERRDDRGGEDADGEAVEAGEEAEVPRGREQLQVVLDRRLQPVPEQRRLGALAPVKGDRLGVLAHAHEPVPEVGLRRLLRKVEAHERAADVERGGGAADRVERERAEEGGVDGVQDPREGGEVERGREGRDREAERGVGEVAARRGREGDELNKL